MNVFFESLWQLTLEMSPYLLLGFLIAGVLHAFVPQRIYARHLSRRGAGSVVNATLLGIPLPLCSCGVLPTTVSLRRSGASRGACTSFLIATPQTGVDSILATYSLLGLPFAIIRPLAALVTGIAGGMATDRLIPDDNTGNGGNGQTATEEGYGNSFGRKVRAALAYAFGELLEDVGRWLVVGLFVAAAITAAIPDGFFASLRDYPFINMLIVLAVAIPMYVCATGSIPIALSLIMKGMTPGAAFVLLMAGPAINAASMLVISKAFGRRQTTIYISSIVVGAIVFGLIMDHMLPVSWFVPSAAATAHGAVCSDCVTEHTAWFSITCSVIFATLLLRALWRRLFGHKHCHCHDSNPDTCGRSVSGNINGKTFSVSGMRCSHCATNVKEAVESLPAVASAVVNLQQGTVSVTLNQTDAIPHADIARQIADAISRAGYKAEIMQ